MKTSMKNQRRPNRKIVRARTFDNLNCMLKYKFAADILASFSTKFDEYKDVDSPVIYDVDEELAIMREMKEKGIAAPETLSKVDVLNEKLEGFNLERKCNRQFPVDHCTA